MLAGSDVIEIAESRLGQKYVFGARAPLDNPNWNGPWDCAEYISWCVYQAYGLIFGAGRVTKPSKAEPYSGYWYDDAVKRGIAIDWQDALRIPGAVLVRRPTPGKIGHVAFAVGDGQHTLEARGAKFGVGRFDKADKRSWTLGCLLPGVNYDSAPRRLDKKQLASAKKPSSMPAGYLWLQEPNLKGPEVVAVQKAVRSKGVDPGPIDGEFGPLTHAAVVAFQLNAGVEVDGVVGPSTAKALGLDFPIPPTDADKKVIDTIRSPKQPARVRVPALTGEFDGIVEIRKVGNSFKAKTVSGNEFSIGSSTTYTDDAIRVGLMQRSAEIADSRQFGLYAAADFKGAFDAWAHFIEPTLNAEGGARFATLNTYDRAAFTFGAPQFAAHTPGENLIEYLRAILALDAAKALFPELEIRANGQGKKTVHLGVGGKFKDLEEVVIVTRPNGKREPQLAHLMAYLNPSSSAIEANELSAAARMMQLLKLDPKARELQVQVFISAIKVKLATAKKKVAKFDGKDWRTALWIMDILHQGRGSYREMGDALGSSDPEGQLKKIGWPKYRSRIKAVSDKIEDLEKSGVMRDFVV